MPNPRNWLKELQTLDQTQVRNNCSIQFAVKTGSSSLVKLRPLIVEHCFTFSNILPSMSSCKSWNENVSFNTDRWVNKLAMGIFLRNPHHVGWVPPWWVAHHFIMWKVMHQSLQRMRALSCPPCSHEVATNSRKTWRASPDEVTNRQCHNEF